jgi:hypothetical protein
MNLNFFESTLKADEFIETVVSSSISSVTDKPPETRVRKPEDDVDTFQIK